MPSMSSDNKIIVKNTLLNIKKAIEQLQLWNADIENTDDWYKSDSGMHDLAANCMLIEAIGEAVKSIEKRAGIDFLMQRPEIPWPEIKGMRNYIAHGYFDIDGEFIFSVIKNDLQPLLVAVEYLLKQIG